ncbi:DUF1937 family protein [Chachezhania sediminis]|uniref:DUF1937 family protein n=1 Tax=Chachezhania sediminis TaxID=2599291 RepID=UPI00131E6732|nr:DUF1937 family protein [Chachezhania sediminis]
MMALPAIPDWQAPGVAACERAGLVRRSAAFADVAKVAKGRLVYLAMPWAGDLAVDDYGVGWDLDAAIAAGEVAAWHARALALLGVCAVPVAAIQSLMLQLDLVDPQLTPNDTVFWTGWTMPLQRACAVVAVLAVPGWDDSPEVWAVLRAAVAVNVPVLVLEDAT